MQEVHKNSPSLRQETHRGGKMKFRKMDNNRIL
jgi:hypothetical protein